MKTYCKKIDILDFDFIADSVFLFFKGDEVRENKWKRRDFRQLLAQVNNVPVKEIRYALFVGDFALLREYTDNVAKIVQKQIYDLIYNNKSLDLPENGHFTRFDNLSGKVRRCVMMKPIHQVAEFVGLVALQELFDAKIEPYQCASVRGRGQVYGKEAIEKWIRRDKQATDYAKCDIVGCFKHIPVKKIVKMLERDIGKNPFLIKYIDALLSYYENGMLEIGTILSASLCNYMLSYAYRYALTITYKRRNKNIRSVKHTATFLDDFIFIGNNVKELSKAVKKVEKYLKDNFNLEFHEWEVLNVKEHPIDMMGYVISYEVTTIRYRIFKRAKRQYIRANVWLKRRAKDIKKNKNHKKRCNYLCLRIARKIISYFGYFKHSDSESIIKKLNINYLTDMAKKTVAYYDRKESNNATNCLLYC